MSTLFDPIRKAWVAATPEERVRQGWLQKMIGDLGFPKSLFSVEKSLRAFSQVPEVPNRRIDLVFFRPKVMTPLLLMECKAEALTEKDLRQVVGYNQFVGAPFLALVNGEESICLGPQGTLATLPSYEEMMRW